MILSALNPFFRAPNEIRLNIGLTMLMFVGLVGLSFIYVELLEGVFPFFVDMDDFRMRMVGSGAVYGGALASLFLFAYKTAYRAKSADNDKLKNLA